MEQPQLVAIVVTADGKRVAMRVPDENRAVSFLARLQQRIRQLLGV
jgi:hypothetical protein